MSESRIERVENGIPPIFLSDSEPPLRVNVEELMRLYKVPGLSIAVIDNFEIAWAKGYGVTEPGSNNPVTVHTLFQAASISKPVAATAALHLVEQGKLALDEDVNLKLESWQVPENEFTKEHKVTLRRILSHSAGVAEPEDEPPDYAVGAPLPTLVQILNGEPPANTPPVHVNLTPGTRHRYSNFAVTIEQQLLIDVTGRPFPDFMRETVLDKIGMSDSTFEQPLPTARQSQAATGTHAGGIPVPGRWRIILESAAGGLWTTPTDLAKFAIEIALSKQGKANHVLSQTMTCEMLKPQIGPAGLGFFVGQLGNPEEFEHNGWVAGFVSFLIMFADTGNGVVIMLNSEQVHGFEKYLIESVATEYGWNIPPQRRNASELLTLTASIKGPEAAIAKYLGLRSVLDRYTLLDLGDYLLSSRQHHAAIEVLKLEVKFHPQFWQAYHYLGNAYLKIDQKDLALENFQKSVELNPQNYNGSVELKKLQGQE